MNKRISLEFIRTYASERNAEAAVARSGLEGLRYIVVPVETGEGVRYGVAFVGMDAIEAGAHFHFNCLA